MNDPRHWACPLCTATCNFEAMAMCQQQGDCPAMHVLHMGFNFYQPSESGRAALLEDWTNPLLNKMNLDWGDYDAAPHN